MLKALIIRFSSIGDIVLTTPVVRCLKEQVKGLELHYVTKAQYACVLDANPHIDRLITIKQKVSEVAGILKSQQYDHVFDLHHNLRSMQVKNAVKAPAHSLNKINWQKWLMVNLKVNKMPERHIVDRYMDTVKTMGVTNDGRGLEYFIPDGEEVSPVEFSDVLKDGYVAFAIGGTFETKKLPAKRISEICSGITKPVVLVGGTEDQVVAQKIVEQSPDRIIEVCGKLSINGSASLIRQADKVITHDTGMMHIAAAFKKEIISVWGNTIPEFGMYPYLSGHGEKGQGHVFQVSGLNCRPCSKLGHSKCPKGHFRCMDEMDFAGMIERVNR